MNRNVNEEPTPKPTKSLAIKEMHVPCAKVLYMYSNDIVRMQCHSLSSLVLFLSLSIHTGLTCTCTCIVSNSNYSTIHVHVLELLR